MPTANPILIPELRVMLAEGDTTGLREVAATSMEALAAAARTSSSSPSSSRST
jgi:hypothetical protein